MTFCTIRSQYYLWCVKSMNFKLLHYFITHFKTIATYTGTHCYFYVQWISTTLHHLSYCCRCNFAYRSFPTRMCNGNNTCLLIDHYNGYTISGIYSKCYIGQCGYECVNIFQLIRIKWDVINHCNIERMGLTWYYQIFKRYLEHIAQLLTAGSNMCHIIASIMACIKTTITVAINNTPPACAH